MYENYTSIMISEKDKGSMLSGADFMQNLPFLSGQANIDNEVEVLRSFTLLKNTVDRSNIKSSIFSYEKSIFSNLFPKSKFVNKTELYTSAPIHIVVDPSKNQATYLNFYIEIIDDNSFKIKAKGDEVYLYNYIDDQIKDVVNNVFFENKYNFGEEISTKYFNFQVLKTPNFDKEFTKDRELYFYLNNSNYQTYDYIGYLTVEPTTLKSSIIKVTLQGTNYNRVTDFLNNLSAAFLDRNLEKKNNAAASTVSFIDNQISGFKDSLSSAEANLKSFRTSNQVMDLSFQGQQVFTKLEDLETEKATLQTQLRYYTYLRDYFKKNMDGADLLAPSSMNVADPILTRLVDELLSLNSERASITRNNANSDNILLKDLNLKISNLKRTLIENVENSVSTISVSINEIDYRLNKLSSQISMMPKTELQLKGIERKFELNSTIYTFLLQKRSEAQIAKASSMPDYEIIEPARPIIPNPVLPKKLLNYIIALFLGIFLPTSVILIVDFFNNRIQDIDEVESLINKPILGRVFHSYRKTKLVVANRPNSSVSESFRSIRTNFQFFDRSGEKQVILMTSASSGDGKSFCAINFASVLALNGSRTVILEFDLRRPKIHQEFGLTNLIGISSYLIDKAVLDDLIVPTEIPNLDIISAGPAAPNPAELISSDATADFIDQLKERYDYIVIDSAPVGLISETYLLMKLADVCVFVVRLEHTVKAAFQNALKGLKNNGFENYSILINDLDIQKETLKQTYDNKYYTDNDKGFFSRLLSKS
jgi:tyrosine-protein kinase Etk/Wzc